MGCLPPSHPDSRPARLQLGGKVAHAGGVPRLAGASERGRSPRCSARPLRPSAGGGGRCQGPAVVARSGHCRGTADSSMTMDAVYRVGASTTCKLRSRFRSGSRAQVGQIRRGRSTGAHPIRDRNEGVRQRRSRRVPAGRRQDTHPAGAIDVRGSGHLPTRTIFRYPLLALSKLWAYQSLSMACMSKGDACAISSVVPGLRGWGGSVVLLGRELAVAGLVLADLLVLQVPGSCASNLLVEACTGRPAQLISCLVRANLQRAAQLVERSSTPGTRAIP